MFSKEILDLLIQKNVLADEDFKDVDGLKSKISQATMIAQAPGELSANAAFAAIVTLAKRHSVLHGPAIEALESSRQWRPELSEKYISELTKHSAG